MFDTMKLSNLQRHWLAIAEQRGLRVQVPFEVHLSDGRVFTADVLVEGYGAPRGMLVVTDSQKIAKLAHDLVDAGYGYSCMSEPDDVEVDDARGVDEVLRDWGVVT